MRRYVLRMLFILLLVPVIGMGQGSDIPLILEDIDDYTIERENVDPLTGKVINLDLYTTVNNAGILVFTGHFPDHRDTTYKVDYVNMSIPLSVEVQVTQHSGSDSDRWLLHEVERGFRSDDLEAEYEGVIKELDGNKIFTWLYGTSYRWVSNNIVVYIRYSDPELSKPEPLEVVRAYLRKFPSSITYTDAYVKTRAHNEQWLRDEMERRIWLSEKWVVLVEDGKGDLYAELREVYRHLDVFLKYREKYLGVEGGDDRSDIENALVSRNVSDMGKKVKELRAWWNKNKTKQLKNVPGN